MPFANNSSRLQEPACFNQLETLAELGVHCCCSSELGDDKGALKEGY